MTVDLTPEAVEAHILRVDPYKMAQPRSLNADTFALLRALSARLAELEAALATARADALREAAAVAEKTGTCLLPSGSFLSERCRDAILAIIPKEKPNDR